MNDFPLLTLNKFDIPIEPLEDIQEIIKKRKFLMENEEIILNLRNIQYRLRNILNRL